MKRSAGIPDRARTARERFARYALLVFGLLVGFTPQAVLAGTLSSTTAAAPSTVNLTTAGTADWIHWGLTGSTSVDRKAGVSPQISNYTALGGATPSSNTSASAGYSWTDGTPTTTATATKTGLRVQNLGAGFQFTAPAGTALRTLKVYLGLNNARAKLVATLSDGSAPNLTTIVDQPTGKLSRVVTVSFQANSAGQTLTLSLTLDAVYAGTFKWAMLESAALQGSGGGGNQAPVLNPIGNQIVTEGQTLAVPVTATDTDGPAPLVLSQTNNLPGSPNILTDNGNGNGVLNWIPAIGASAGSPYSVTATATDASSAASSRTLSVIVVPAGPPSTQPNILMILSDDQGYGDVAYTGHAPDLRTPQIDTLAAQGMRFDNFYANSNVCSPTRAALLTGRYPALVGVPGTVARDPETNMGHLAPTGPTLPELLKANGYNTAMVGKWHLGDYLGENPANIPTRRGFDHFHGTIGSGGDYYTHDGSKLGWPGNNLLMLNETVLNPASLQGQHTTDLLTQWAKDYIQSQAAATQPFLLYLAYTAPHDPVQPPQAYLNQVLAREPGITTARAKLVALIEHMDNSIGQVIQKLKDTGKYQNTLIIFSSDNGGYRTFAANNGPYRGGKLDFYEGGIRVPATAVWPGVIAPGTQTDAVALTMDLYATIADAAGATVSPTIEGQSLLPILLGETAEIEPRDLFFENRSTISVTRWLTHYAVRRGDWKLVQNAPGGSYELYNLAADPYEIQNVATTNPTLVASLTAALNGYKAQEALVPWQPAIELEKGVTTGLTAAWRTINLSRRYRAPVVVATEQYSAGMPPVVTRLRNITDLSVDHASFDIRLQRVDGLSGAVPPINVNYAVFEAGVFNEAHQGATLEAMRFNSTLVDHTASWMGTSRRYVNSYSQPAVLGQVLSYNNTRFSTFWSRGASAIDAPSASTLYVGKHIGEDPTRARNPETIGYVAIESGIDTLDGQTVRAGVSSAVVSGIDDAPPYVVPLSGLSQATNALVSQEGMKGTNGSWAVLYGANAVSPARLNVAVDEDQLADSERSHPTPEKVGYIVFGTASGALTVATPTISPAAGTYAGSVAVTLSTATSGASLYYTLDGTDPSTSSTRVLYGTPFTLTNSATVRAVGQRSGYIDSAVVASTYTITSAGGGSLSATVATAPTLVNLTTQGTSDWIHWGRTTLTAVDRRSGVTPQISTFSPVGGVSPFVSSSATAGYSWTNGTPTAAITNTKTGLRISPTLGAGFRFTVPANTTLKTLKVYVGVNNARGKLTATLSDGSAPAITTYANQPTGKSSHLITVSFRANSAGQTLTINFTTDTVYGGTPKWIMLESAALQ